MSNQRIQNKPQNPAQHNLSKENHVAGPIQPFQRLESKPNHSDKPIPSLGNTQTLSKIKNSSGSLKMLAPDIPGYSQISSESFNAHFLIFLKILNTIWPN